jgi:hypothetical protein
MGWIIRRVMLVVDKVQGALQMWHFVYHPSRRRFWGRVINHPDGK